MATMKQVLDLADELGVDVEDTGNTIYLTTRGTRMFRGHFQHCLATTYRGGMVDYKSKSYALDVVMDDLKCAIVDCDLVPCDYCYEIFEENN